MTLQFWLMTHGYWQFRGYACVGALGTAVQYALLVLGVSVVGASAVISSSVGAVFGAITNYALNCGFTFHSRKARSEALAMFSVIPVVGLATNGAVVDTAKQFFGPHYLVAQVVATTAVLFGGFVAIRVWTFKKEARAQRST